MIAMQEKKLIRIPFLLLPKARYEKSEEHTITPPRQPKRHFFSLGKQLTKAQKSSGHLILRSGRG